MIPNFVFENIIRNDPSNRSLYVKNILEAETHREDRKVFRALRKKGLVSSVEHSHVEHILNYDNQQDWDYRKDRLVEEFKQHHQLDPDKVPTHYLTQHVDGIYDLFHDIYDRESLNGNNIPVNVFIRYGKKYNNAFYEGHNIVFGEGDGVYFKDFTLPSVVGHEFCHGVQDYESAFEYYSQSGALNEHVADVFGIMFDQILKKQDVHTSKWLIGEGLWTDNVDGVALRSMKEPGTAYNDAIVGMDPQPSHMDNYDTTPDDYQGVHINSGIPNKAFYLANISKGGKIHENGMGKIWYNTILKKNGLDSKTNFIHFAQATVDNAQERKDKEIIFDAWEKVGIKTALPDINPEPEPEPESGCGLSNILKGLEEWIRKRKKSKE